MSALPRLPRRAEVTGAVDIGGTKIAAGLVDAQGAILAQGQIPTLPEGGFQPALERLTALLSQLCSEAGCLPAGIGIGSTGPIDPLTGRYGRPDLLPTWEGQPLTAALNEQTGLTCYAENDADAHALGEAAFGAGRGADPFVMVTVGTGMGTALILHGQVYRGLGGAHPEMGHLVVEAGGPPCVCGARGCWESLATGPAWEAWFRTTYPAKAAWDGREICAAARVGDADAQEAVRREGYYLGVGLSTLMNVLAPHTIALGGGVMESFDLFEPFMRAEIRARCTYMPVEQLRLVPAGLGQAAGLVGAAQVWHRRQESHPGGA